MRHSIYYYYTLVKPHQHSRHYFFFLPNFPIIFLIFTISLTFLPPLLFHLPTIIYLNITIHLPLYLPLFCLFLLTTSYYKFFILSFILCIFFPYKRVISLSLSLSLSLSIFWWIFLFFLHLHFRLINFCVF